MEKSIGALWIKTGSKGEYWTGYIELPNGTKQNVIVFKNTYKKDNQPDFRIYEQKAKEKKEEEATFNTEETEVLDELPF